jgi:hypothetical protein
LAVLSAFSILGACSPASQSGGEGGGETGKFAGLDTQIHAWRTQILASDPLCRSQVKEQACQNFDVACKAERVVTPPEQAKGVTAHVVAAMTFDGWDPKLKQSQSGSRTSEFTKDATGWSRADHAPVNTSTCADL